MQHDVFVDPELRARKIDLIRKARTILDRAKEDNDRQLTSQENIHYEELMSQVDEIQLELDSAYRARTTIPEAVRDSAPSGRTERGDGRFFGCELRALVEGSGSGSYVAPPEYGNQAWQLLAAESVGLASGFTVIPTDRDALKFPRLGADVTAGFYAEAGTITAADPTVTQITATPKKLAAITTVSNELIADSSPEIIRLLELSQTRALALAADLDFFEGSGSSNHLTGLKNVSGIGAVSMGTNGAALTNLDPFADAIGTLAQSNASATAIVMHPRTWQSALKLKEQTSGNNKPLLQESAGSGSQGVQRSIYGIKVYLCNQLSITETQGSSSVASSAYVYQADQVVVVRRKEIEVVVNPWRLFNSDQSEMRSIMRLDLVVPNPTAVVRIAGIL